MNPPSELDVRLPQTDTARRICRDLSFFDADEALGAAVSHLADQYDPRHWGSNSPFWTGDHDGLQRFVYRGVQALRKYGLEAEGNRVARVAGIPLVELEAVEQVNFLDLHRREARYKIQDILDSLTSRNRILAKLENERVSGDLAGLDVLIATKYAALHHFGGATVFTEGVPNQVTAAVTYALKGVDFARAKNIVGKDIETVPRGTEPSPEYLEALNTYNRWRNEVPSHNDNNPMRAVLRRREAEVNAAIKRIESERTR